MTSTAREARELENNEKMKKREKEALGSNGAFQGRGEGDPRSSFSHADFLAPPFLQS